jgi:hypothetical protein
MNGGYSAIFNLLDTARTSFSRTHPFQIQNRQLMHSENIELQNMTSPAKPKRLIHFLFSKTSGLRSKTASSLLANLCDANTTQIETKGIGTITAIVIMSVTSDLIIGLLINYFANHFCAIASKLSSGPRTGASSNRHTGGHASSAGE